MGDVLIKNGLILDGTGREGFLGHVSVAGDKIESVIPAGTPAANDIVAKGSDKSIDADGSAVAPGFIDCHSHFDWVLPLPHHQKFLFPMVEQGITTVVAGNCGFSPAPVSSESKDLLSSISETLLDETFPYEWRSMAEFLEYLESDRGLLFNMAQLAGHGALHLAVTGDHTRRPGSVELATMLNLTAEALDEGAIGLSLGLMYPPGLFSDKQELLAMTQVAVNKGRILTVHKRALSKYSGSYPVIPFFDRAHNLKALDEILSIAGESGVRLQISHLIFAGKKSWTTAEKALNKIEKASNRGLEVMFDIYPHFCGNSYLTVFLPAWFIQNLDDNLENPKALKRLRFELGLAKYLLGFDMADIQIMQAGYSAGEKYNGQNIVEIARQEGIDPVGAMLKIIKESSGKALQLTYGYSGDDAHEQLIEKLMAHELCLFETDTILKSSGFANPASYGAFPRILGRFTRDKNILGLAEAVSKMSGRTAHWMGIAQRGEIIAGNFADIVLFDPNTIADNTTIRETARRPTGIEKVFINGELVVDDGKYIADQKAGRVVRPD
ncbi:MAG: amidohydrolase family protein [Desulfobacterales bacterium]|nr:amidohydrolase family protein [Desulfobacterales bacterium]